MTPDPTLDPGQIPKKVPTKASERQSSDWDIRNAPKNYVSLVVTQIGSAFFSFASVWIITRYLGSEGYGGIVAIIAASQLVQVLVNWSSVAVVRFGTEEFVETSKIARTFWLRLFIFVPNLLLIVLASNLWFPSLASWLRLTPEAFWLVILHFAASVLWIHIQFSLQAVKMPRLQGKLLTIERLLIFFGLLVLLVAGKFYSVSVLLCYAVTPLLMSAAGFWYLRNFVFVKFALDWMFWKKIIAFSLPLAPYFIIGSFSTGYVDAIFLSKYLSTKDLGIYSVATQINGIALQLPTLANTLLLPFFVTLQKEGQPQKTSRYFKHVLPTLTLSWGLICTMAAFTGYFLIPLIFGREFASSTMPLWILLATSTLNIPVLIGYSSLSNATSTTYISLVGAVFMAIVNLGFNFLLIPVFGMIGCAWATSIMYLTTSLTFGVFLRKVAGMPVSWTFAAMTPCIGGAVLVSLTGNPWWSLLICMVLTSFVIYLKKHSFGEALLFLRKIRNS